MNNYRPQNYRIYRLVTKTRILTVEDALKLRKIIYTLTDYEKGTGAKTSVVHYMDHDRAALLSWNLLNHRPNTEAWWNGDTEFKGTTRSGQLHARTMTVELAQGTRHPIRITITNGPGEPAGTAGAIKPKTDAPQQIVTTLLTWQDARTMALQTMLHLSAWHTMTYYSRLQEETWTNEDDSQQRTVDPATGEILDD
jgi:hypothetical protein